MWAVIGRNLMIGGIWEKRLFSFIVQHPPGRVASDDFLRKTLPPRWSKNIYFFWNSAMVRVVYSSLFEERRTSKILCRLFRGGGLSSGCITTKRGILIWRGQYSDQSGRNESPAFLTQVRLARSRCRWGLSGFQNSRFSGVATSFPMPADCCFAMTLCIISPQNIQSWVDPISYTTIPNDTG